MIRVILIKTISISIYSECKTSSLNQIPVLPLDWCKGPVTFPTIIVFGFESRVVILYQLLMLISNLASVLAYIVYNPIWWEIDLKV